MSNEVITLTSEQQDEVATWGVTSQVVEIPASAASQYLKLYNWKMRSLPSIGRPAFDGWLSQHLTSECAMAAAKYADTQKDNAIEKLVFAVAKAKNITPLEAANDLQVTLRERK